MRPYAKVLGPKLRYQLRDSDVLWTARAVVYEGGDPAATLWTLTQRFALGAYRQYPSFASFVRAFSQPVNPRWARRGEFCRPGGQYANSASCDDDRLLRRLEASTASWAAMRKVDPGAVDAVTAWSQGLLPNPVPGATNFADPAVAQGYLERNPAARVVLRAGNVYIDEGKQGGVAMVGAGVVAAFARAVVHPTSWLG